MSPHRLTGPLALAATLGLAAALAAADPARSPRTSDVVLARAALKALDDDPQLRDVNLVVSVVDRVAVVGGPVPNPDAAKRAERVLRDKVPGLADVKNRCFEQKGGDPLIRMIADRRADPLPIRDGLPGVIPDPAGTMAFTPAPRPQNQFPAIPSDRSVTVLRPNTAPAAGVLLDPVRPDRLPVPPARPDSTNMAAAPPAVLTTTTGSGRPGDLLLAAASIRRANPGKFGGLTAELRAGTLIVGGSARQAAHAWEYAEALRRVPGMVRVAVGTIDVP
jgi:hypothetical protein